MMRVVSRRNQWEKWECSATGRTGKDGDYSFVNNGMTAVLQSTRLAGVTLPCVPKNVHLFIS